MAHRPAHRAGSAALLRGEPHHAAGIHALRALRDARHADARRRPPLIDGRWPGDNPEGMRSPAERNMRFEDVPGPS